MSSSSATADAWEVLSHSPGVRSRAGSARLEGRIHILGGHLGIEDDATPDHVAFDLATSTWLRAPDLPVSLAAMATVEAGGSLWVLGGWNPDLQPTLRREVWIFTPG